MINIEYIVDTKLCHLEVKGLHAAFEQIEQLYKDHDVEYWSVSKGIREIKREWTIESLKETLDEYGMWYVHIHTEKDDAMHVVSHDNHVNILTHTVFTSNTEDEELCKSIIAAVKVLLTQRGKDIPEIFK